MAPSHGESAPLTHRLQTVDEVVSQYHISEDTIRRSSTIRGPEGSIWVLRVDVEALALQLYGTRAFHDAHPDQMGKPCTICAIVKFTPKQKAVRIRTSPKFDRRLVVQKRKSKRRSN